MKVQELRNLSQDELTAALEERKKKIFDMSFQRKYGRVEKPHLFQVYRKDIARILTILKELENDK